MDEKLLREEVIRHYEGIIQKIKDVVSAKIITTPDGKISEIHVLANSNRNPKQIVRDIESALIATFGSEIDHKKISVAQLEKEDNCTAETRLRIDGLTVKKGKYSYEVAVSLRDAEDKVYEGRASGSGTYKHYLKLIAQATINAIQQYAGKDFLIALEDINTFRIGEREAIAVLVSILTNGGEESFLGSSIFREDKGESVVVAVLNAVNRRLSFLIKEKKE